MSKASKQGLMPADEREAKILAQAAQLSERPRKRVATARRDREGNRGTRRAPFRALLEGALSVM